MEPVKCHYAILRLLYILKDQIAIHHIVKKWRNAINVDLDKSNLNFVNITFFNSMCCLWPINGSLVCKYCVMKVPTFVVGVSSAPSILVM